jgi:hypothetical protein
MTNHIILPDSPQAKVWPEIANTCCLVSKGKGKGIGYARKLWIKKYGPLPYKQLVCHKCDNIYGFCYNLDHIFIGSYKDNTIDAANKGRLYFLKGKHHPKEHCHNISKGRKGMKFTKEHCHNISKGRTGIKLGPPSLEKRKKSSDFLKGKPSLFKGRKHTPESILKCKLARKAYWTEERRKKQSELLTGKPSLFKR